MSDPERHVACASCLVMTERLVREHTATGILEPRHMYGLVQLPKRAPLVSVARGFAFGLFRK